MTNYNERIKAAQKAIKDKGYYSPEIWFAFNFCGYPVYFSAAARASESYSADRAEWTQNYNESDNSVEQGLADLWVWIDNLPSVAETRRVGLLKRAAQLQRDIEKEGIEVPNLHFENIIKALSKNALEDKSAEPVEEPF